MRTRIFAIGDIHGCLGHLDALLDAIALTPTDRLILLGDLVDRGLDPAGVLRRVRELRSRFNVSVICGNHEQLMRESRESHDKFSDWLRNGGDKTLASYTGQRGKLHDVPDEDWDFVTNGLVDFIETDSHIFVHANAYPDMAMADQPPYMLRWERCDRMSPHESGKTLVCGHTPQRSGRPLNLGYGICLDTNACRGGRLSCMEVNSGTVWQADESLKIERSHISDYES